MFSHYPDPQRPIMMIRLRAGYDRQLWQRLAVQLGKYREACDEVWFSTGSCVLPPDECAVQAAEYAEYAEDLRKLGIVPSLQIQATLGHGDRIAMASGVKELSWHTWVGVNGEKCRYITCPRAPEFLDRLRKACELHAQWHPGSVWIDDDLRPGNHEPAWEPYGCYCPDCLAEFSRMEGRTFSRERLVEEYGKDPELKKRWESFATTSLCRVAGVVAETFRRISPETVMGLQHCAEKHRIPVLKTLHKTSGKRVSSRPGGGAYSDHIPYAIPDKAFLMQMQMFEQPGYDITGAVCPEIESCPRGFCSKTSHGHRLESLLYLAAGMDCLSYFIMDPKIETPEWYGENLLKPLAEEAACYRDFAEHNTGTLPAGAGFAGHFDSVDTRASGWALAGVPMAGFAPGASCCILNGPMVKGLTDDELKKVVSGNIILDGAATEQICKRGFADLLNGITAEVYSDPYKEFYTDDAMTKDLDSDIHSSFSFSGNRFSFAVPEGLNIRILGNYKDIDGNTYGAATLLCERADGTRAAFVGDDGYYLEFVSSSRITLINRIADWVGGGKFPVMAESPLQCLIIPRVAADGYLRSVTVMNTVIGSQKPFRIQLRNLPESVQEAEWCVPAADNIKVPVSFENGTAYAVIPEIPGWGIGWLKINL